jgi:hypothetical protein
MAEKTLNLTISLDGGGTVDQNTLYQLTGQVLKDVDRTGVHSIRRASSAEVPEGTKGIPVDVNTLLISLGSAGVLTAVIQLLKDWVLRAEGRKVRIRTEIESKNIEFEYSPSATSEEELMAFADKMIQLLNRTSSERS